MCDGLSHIRLMCDGLSHIRLMCDSAVRFGFVWFAEAIRNVLRIRYDETIRIYCVENTLRVPNDIFSTLGQILSVSTRRSAGEPQMAEI